MTSIWNVVVLQSFGFHNYFTWPIILPLSQFSIDVVLLNDHSLHACNYQFIGVYGIQKPKKALLQYPECSKGTARDILNPMDTSKKCLTHFDTSVHAQTFPSRLEQLLDNGSCSILSPIIYLLSHVVPIYLDLYSSQSSTEMLDLFLLGLDSRVHFYLCLAFHTLSAGFPCPVFELLIIFTSNGNVLCY